MKFCSFLISFMFVNVSTYNITDYIGDVVITNAHIELAYNMNNCIIKGRFVLNGLEHVIKKMVETKKYSLASMNNMFAVPEFRPFYNDWNELIDTQTALREVIQSELNIPVPQVPEETIYEKLTLADLGVKRREFTGIALKNILNRITNFREPENVTDLIQQKRLGGKDALENRIINALAGPEKEISFTWMCCLIALFTSTKSPWSHIQSIQMNPNSTCTLSDSMLNKCSTKKLIYGKIEGQWYQVIGNEVQLLKDLL